MALRAFMGFELGRLGTVATGSGTSGKYVSDLQSLDHYRDYYGVAHLKVGTDTSSTFSCVGVTGDPADQLGSGANVRNGLLSARYQRGSGNRSLFELPSYKWFIHRNAESYRYVLGFTFRIDRRDTLNTPLHILHAVYQAGAITTVPTVTASANPTFGLRSSATVLSFGNFNSTFQPQYGQEYYAEIVSVSNAGSAQFWFEIYIDGELILTSTPESGVSDGVPLRWCIPSFGWNSGADGVAAVQRVVTGDFVFIDHTGDAPYNDRIGPQMVLPFTPNNVISSEWEPSSGEDPLELITGPDRFNDSNYVVSPYDDGALIVTADMPVSNNNVINGVELWVKATREGGANRDLLTTATNTQAEEIGPVTVAMTDSIKYHRAFTVLPSSATDVEPIAASRIQPLEFELKGSL